MMNQKKNNTINMLIGKDIQTARLRKDITQQQIADFMGVTVQTVSMWENGTDVMNLDDFFTMCNHFCFDAIVMIRSAIKASNGNGTIYRPI